MQKADVIIVGAGMCGLSTAAQLVAKGKTVILLEARNRAGGRVENHMGAFGNVVQAGPEFIHGNLPFTKALVKRVGGTMVEHEGEMYRSQEGHIFPVKEFAPHMKEFMKRADSLKTDMSLSDFLDKHFSAEKYSELRKAVSRTAEGFDAADVKRISVKSLMEEWNSDSMQGATVLKEGYGILVKELSEQCIAGGCELLFSRTVNTIRWEQGKVSVTCSDKKTYEAKQIIVTVSLGVLLSRKQDQAHITFDPAMPEKLKAAKDMGFGPVVKVVMECKSRFWKDARYKGDVQQIPDLAFLLNESVFPTVWVSNANEIPLITCWAGGSVTKNISDLTPGKLRNKALSALAKAFQCSETFIRSQVMQVHVFNWAKDAFTKGAYSYVTPQTKLAKEILRTPVLNTVFFGGEALGATSGTVEAALESAYALVSQLLPSKNK